MSLVPTSMSVSFKKSTTKTNINHNNRKFTEKQKEKNEHINYDKSEKNLYLIQKDLKEVYEEEFGEALKNYNQKQKRKDRKIDSYYEHIKDSKKTSLQQEMIVQIGDKEDYSDKILRVRIAHELKRWLQGFEERNPNLKVYNAVVHLDEATPHLHFNFVPVASGYKRSLEKQVSFDKAIKQQDRTLDKKRPFADWREKEVNILADQIEKELFIERKIVGTNDYKDVNEYKKMQDLEKELDKKIAIKQEQLSYLNAESDIDKSKFDDLQAKWETKKVEVPTGEKTILNNDKMKTIDKKTDRVVMDVKKYRELRKIAKKSNENKNLLDIYQSFNFTSDWADRGNEIERLKDELQEEKDEHNQDIDDYNELLDEKRELVNENNVLRSEITDLRAEIKSIYQSTKNVLKERTNDFKAFMKDIVSDVVSDLKDNRLASSFKKEFDKEDKKERTKSRRTRR